MTAYRKKPVVIEAWKIDHDSEQPEWVKAEFRAETLDWCPSGEGLWINTLEGCMVGSMGDMLIRGIKGEFYACKPDIFEATYELATHPQAPAFPQPEAEAQKAVACDENELLADFYEASGTMVNGDQVFGTIRHNDLLQLIRAARDTTPSAGAPLPEQRQEAAQVEAHALAEEAKTAWGRQDPKRLWIAIEALATPPASSRVAAPTPQAVKVPLTPEQIKRELDAAKVPDSEDDAYDFQVWRACERFYGIHPTEGERSHD